MADAKRHSPNPLLCKIYTNAGHEGESPGVRVPSLRAELIPAGSKSIKERVGEVVDRLVFVLKSTSTSSSPA